MNSDSESQMSQIPAGPPQPPSLPGTFQAQDLIRCPHCGSTQFFGRRKITGFGWFLYISALLNIPVSFLLMFVLIGWVTIFLTPVMAIIGFYACRRHVNTCARCKKDF